MIYTGFRPSSCQRRDYNDFFEIGQQKINFNFYELSLPDDDPVYTLKKVMEDLNFSGLGSLTATDSLYKPQTLIKTGFQSYFFVNLFVILCSYL